MNNTPGAMDMTVGIQELCFLLLGVNPQHITSFTVIVPKYEHDSVGNASSEAANFLRGHSEKRESALRPRQIVCGATKAPNVFIRNYGNEEEQRPWNCEWGGATRPLPRPPR